MHDLQVNKRSAQRNSNFQKLFSLPVEEFLINDFACAIKRKIPIQVRFKLSLYPLIVSSQHIVPKDLTLQLHILLTHIHAWL